jgi:hypothetical protein
VLVLVVSSAHRGQPLPPGFAMVSGLSRRGSRTSRELATHARGRSRKEIEEVVGVQLAPGGGPAVWLQKPSCCHTYIHPTPLRGGRQEHTISEEFTSENCASNTNHSRFQVFYDCLFLNNRRGTLICAA